MRKIRRLNSILIIAALFFVLPYCKKGDGGSTPPPPPPPPPANTFVNPLLTGADPWVLKKDNQYYYTQTLGNRVGLWKTTTMSKLGSATNATIYTPPAGSSNSHNVWAPEIHFVDNKWYVYYTAGAGPDSTQRTWVLENSGADPMAGTWTSKGRIWNSDADFWAIDGTVFELNGINYFLWSGRPNISFQNQNIYIAKMINPWTLQTPTVTLTQPQLAWETVGGPVNEAPEIIRNNAGKIFMVYSASGCWTDDYALGLLTLKDGGNPLIATDWSKSTAPVFTKKPESNAYGPGHNGFFKSPDGTEDWIIYHANEKSGDGCDVKRSIRMQSFTWNGDGSPNLGRPVKTGVGVVKPKGE